jgi:hypothetical protein
MFVIRGQGRPTVQEPGKYANVPPILPIPSALRFQCGNSTTHFLAYFSNTVLLKVDVFKFGVSVLNIFTEESTDQLAASSLTCGEGVSS